MGLGAISRSKYKLSGTLDRSRGVSEPKFVVVTNINLVEPNNRYSAVPNNRNSVVPNNRNPVVTSNRYSVVPNKRNSVVANNSK